MLLASPRRQHLSGSRPSEGEGFGLRAAASGLHRALAQEGAPLSSSTQAVVKAALEVLQAEVTARDSAASPADLRDSSHARRASAALGGEPQDSEPPPAADPAAARVAVDAERALARRASGSTAPSLSKAVSFKVAGAPAASDDDVEGRMTVAKALPAPAPSAAPAPAPAPAAAPAAAAATGGVGARLVAWAARTCWLGPRTRAALSALVVAAAVLNCLVFPVQLAFGGPVCVDDPTWGAYLAADVLLWLEVAANFCTPLALRGEIQYSHSAVAWAYLGSGRLALDLACRLPWSAIERAADAELALHGGACYSLGHLPRLLLVHHLTRVAARFVNWKRPDPSVERALLRGMSTFSRFVVLLHWYACLQYAVGRSPYLHEGAPSWVEREGVTDRPAWARYVRSLDRALLIVLGEGVDRETDAEIALSLLGLLAGTALVAFFTSTMV